MNRIQQPHVVLFQPDIRGLRILSEICDLFSARYRHNFFILGQQPRQRNLPGGGVIFFRQRRYRVKKLQIVVDIVLLETVIAFAEIVFDKIAVVTVFTRQETSAQR